MEVVVRALIDISIFGDTGLANFDNQEELKHLKNLSDR